MTEDRPNAQRFEFALLPNTPDTVLFVELSHFAGGDLSPAATALEHANEFFQRGEVDSAGFLVDFAVVSYCRAFVPSSVRNPLDQHFAVPAEFASVHERIRAYRNTTVAHSQSELSTTWPIVAIDTENDRQRRVWGPTISQPLPWGIVEDFRNLIDALLDRLHDEIEALRRRLEAEVISMGSLPALPADSMFVAALDQDFTARSRRRPYPTRQTFYWSLDVHSAAD